MPSGPWPVLGARIVALAVGAFLVYAVTLALRPLFGVPAIISGLTGLAGALLDSVILVMLPLVFLLVFLRSTWSVTAGENYLELKQTLATRRVSIAGVRVRGIVLWSGDVAIKATLTFESEHWLALPLGILLSGGLSGISDAPQCARLLDYLAAKAKSCVIEGWPPKSYEFTQLVEVARAPDGALLLKRPGTQLATELLAKGGLLLVFAIIYAVNAVASHASSPTVVTHVHSDWLGALAWWAPLSVVAAVTVASLLSTKVHVRAGETLEIRDFLHTVKIPWHRIRALESGRFSRGLLDYPPGSGYLLVRFANQNGGSRSLVLPPEFGRSDEFRKALLSKLEQAGRPGLVIE